MRGSLFPYSESIHLVLNSNLGVRVEVGTQMRQRFGHIFAAEAKADVAGLVINAAWKQQNAGVADNVFAEFERVALGLEVHEADGTGVRLYPFEQMGALLEESVKKAQIALHDF